MIRLFDIILLSILLLNGLVNTARVWEYLGNRHERVVTVLHLALLAGLHYTLSSSHLAHRPVQSGSYVLFFPILGFTIYSIRSTIKRGGKR